MSVEKELALLEDWIRRIKIEYEIYFGGGRKTPPYDLKNKIESTIKRFYDKPHVTYGDRYRFTTLADRYNAYRDMWRRQLQRLEEQGRLRAAGNIPEHKPVEAARLVVDFSKPEQEESKVERLFEFYRQTRKKYEGTEDSNLTLGQFQRFVATKTAELKQKYGADEVAFQVKVADGVVKVTAQAKPAQKSSGPAKKGE